MVINTHMSMYGEEEEEQEGAHKRIIIPQVIRTSPHAINQS